jgi:hypothetical protein
LHTVCINPYQVSPSLNVQPEEKSFYQPSLLETNDLIEAASAAFVQVLKVFQNFLG